MVDQPASLPDHLLRLHLCAFLLHTKQQQLTCVYWRVGLVLCSSDVTAFRGNATYSLTHTTHSHNTDLLNTLIYRPLTYPHIQASYIHSHTGLLHTLIYRPLTYTHIQASYIPSYTGLLHTQCSPLTSSGHTGHQGHCTCAQWHGVSPSPHSSLSPAHPMGK